MLAHDPNANYIRPPCSRDRIPTPCGNGDYDPVSGSCQDTWIAPMRGFSPWSRRGRVSDGAPELSVTDGDGEDVEKLISSGRRNRVPCSSSCEAPGELALRANT